MNYTIQHTQNERKDKTKSAVITFLVSLLVFLAIFFYKFTKITEKPQEMVTTMLINFGDNQNGAQEEEPANQEGSLAANTEISVPEPIQEKVAETKPEPVVEPAKPVKEKILTGSNTKVSAPKVEKVTKPKPKPPLNPPQNQR